MSELAQHRIRGMGWIPDLPDQRDMLEDQFAAAVPLKPVPPDLRKFSLRAQDPEPPYDQGQLGSCTGNGWSYAVQFRRKAQGLPAFRPSRLYIYYYERVILGTVDQDSGAMIRDGAKVVSKQGAPDEAGWPYDISRFAEVPPAAEQQAGQQAQVIKYARVGRNLASIKRFIYNGYPVVHGFTVYTSFESQQVANDGRMPIPQRSEEVLGGHCTTWMGWDDDAPIPGSRETGVLETRNSWSPQWGDGGYYWMPYAVALNRGMCSDTWVAEVVEAPAAA